MSFCSIVICWRCLEVRNPPVNILIRCKAKEQSTFASYRLSKSSSSAVRSWGLTLLNGSLVFRGTLPGLPLSFAIDFGSEDWVVAVTTAATPVDVRLFLAGFGESASDSGADGGGGVGSAVFALVTISSSEDESEFESDELEELEASLFTVLAFFDLLFTSTFISSSLELESECEELSLNSFAFFTNLLCSFPLAFTSSSSLELELSSLVSAVSTFFAATLSVSESEFEASLEPSVLLEQSGEGFFLGTFFNADFFLDAVEASAAITLSVFLVELVLSVEHRTLRVCRYRKTT